MNEITFSIKEILTLIFHIVIFVLSLLVAISFMRDISF